MSETENKTAEPQEQLSYETYKRAIAEKKKFQTKLEKMQEQLDAMEAERAKQLEAEKAKQGQFEQLYNELKAKHESTAKAKDEYLTELNTYKELLAKDIPEDIRATFDITGLSVKQVQVLSDKFKETPPQLHSLGSEEQKQEGKPADLSSMDLSQLNKLAAENPSAYFEMFNKRAKGN